MSIENTVPAPATPTKLRILAVIMHSGIAVPKNTTGPGTQIDNGDGTFSDAGDGPVTYGCEYTTPFYAEIIVQACNPMVDGGGNPILNVVGLPVYNDVGNPKSFKITEISELVPFLPTWSGIIDAAEAETAARISSGLL